MLAVVSGERPPKPENAEGTGMTEVVWEFLKECWREDRTTRPSISNILKRFYDITGEKRTQSGLVQCDWDVPSLERPHPTNQCGLTGGSLLAPDPSTKILAEGPSLLRQGRLVNSPVGNHRGIVAMRTINLEWRRGTRSL